MLIKDRKGGGTPREWVEKQNLPQLGKVVRNDILKKGFGTRTVSNGTRKDVDDRN